MIQFPIEAVITDLNEQLQYLIAELGVTYEKDELLKLSGRIYEINKMIQKLQEM